jgi:hypothetical protein
VSLPRRATVARMCVDRFVCAIAAALAGIAAIAAIVLASM